MTRRSFHQFAHTVISTEGAQRRSGEIPEFVLAFAVAFLSVIPEGDPLLD
jgi:hypothetical protein